MFRVIYIAVAISFLCVFDCIRGSQNTSVAHVVTAILEDFQGNPSVIKEVIKTIFNEMYWDSVLSKKFLNNTWHVLENESGKASIEYAFGKHFVSDVLDCARNQGGSGNNDMTVVSSKLLALLNIENLSEFSKSRYVLDENEHVGSLKMNKRIIDCIITSFIMNRLVYFTGVPLIEWNWRKKGKPTVLCACKGVPLVRLEDAFEISSHAFQYIYWFFLISNKRDILGGLSEEIKELVRIQTCNTIAHVCMHLVNRGITTVFPGTGTGIDRFSARWPSVRRFFKGIFIKKYIDVKVRTCF